MPSPAIKLPSIRKLNYCDESPIRSSAQTGKAVESRLDENPVQRYGPDLDNNRWTNDGSLAGVDSLDLFGTPTGNAEGVDGHRHLLYSLGSHLESLGGFLVDCGGSQEENLKLFEEDLAALIARSEWKDLTQPFVRIPAAAGLSRASPSAARANKQPVPQPTSPDQLARQRNLAGLCENGKEDEASEPFPSSGRERTEESYNTTFYVEHAASKRAGVDTSAETDDDSKYKADYSIYAKAMHKSSPPIRDASDKMPNIHDSSSHVTSHGRLSLTSMGEYKLVNNPGSIAEGTVGVVIIINAIVMGVSEDIPWAGWEILEYFFTLFFLCEMVLKMYNHGIRDYFLGLNRYWNWFDFFIVVIALFDAGMTMYMRSTQGGDGTDLGQFAQIKIIRLGRLGRLVRLLRFKFFNELKVMIQGVFAGLRVLFWAVVLFFSFIYLLAIVAVNVLADDTNPLIKERFDKVPWAMLTLFTCFTDGCTASNGTPLSYHLFNEYGAPFMVSYMLCVLFVIIGLFNLIMAIFVDNVMESKRLTRQEARSMDRTDVEARLRRIVRQCCSEQDIDFEKDNLSITRDMFCQLLSHKKLEQILESLDIETCNRVELFDVIDADMSGELDLEEIIAGLLSLRGPSEKKDAVGALLCGRMTQQLLKELRDQMEDECHRIHQEQQQLRLFLMHGACPSTPIPTD